MLSVGTQQLCGKLLRGDSQHLADLLAAVRLRMQHLVHQSLHLLQRGLQLCLNLGQLQQPAWVQTPRLSQHLSSHQQEHLIHTYYSHK